MVTPDILGSLSLVIALLAFNNVVIVFNLYFLSLKLFGISLSAGSRGHDFFVRLLLYKALAIGTAWIASYDSHTYTKYLYPHRVEE